MGVADLVRAHDGAADCQAGRLHGRQHARKRPLHLAQRRGQALQLRAAPLIGLNRADSEGLEIPWTGKLGAPGTFHHRGVCQPD